MIDWKNRDPREVLERLDRFLADEKPDDELPSDELPTEEEAAAIIAAMGIDVAAVTARLMAQVDAYVAGRSLEGAPPSSHVREADGHRRVPELAAAKPTDVAPEPVAERASGIRIRRRTRR